MKKIIEQKKLEDNILKAIHMLCDTVGITLGPSGRNVLITNSENCAFITNDGVTIARNIDSDDEGIKAILSILKEASLKTEEEVGDGTTTTLVLLKTLVLEGLKEIKKINPMLLKKELEGSLNEVLFYLEKEKFIPTKEDLIFIAETSTNDQKMAEVLVEAYYPYQNKNAVIIKEGSSHTKIEKKSGYTFSCGVLSYAFLDNQKDYCYEDVSILLLNDELDNIEDISLLYNEVNLKEKVLIILANAYSEEVINAVLELNYQTKSKIILIENVDYNVYQYEILEDLQALTNGKIVKLNEISIEALGSAKKIMGSLEETTILGNDLNSKKLKEHIKALEERKETLKEEQKIDIDKRICKLKKGCSIIYVGGETKTERKEKIMRYIDGLWAIDVSKEGIVYGSGIAYLKAKEHLKEKTIGSKIIAKALEQPFLQIMKNAGKDEQGLFSILKEKNYKVIYNVLTDTFEQIESTKVKDPYLVVKKALLTAVSIASILLTTSYITINTWNDLEIEK